MLTKLTIRNFKRFDEVEIELGENVVLIGPNNSGKTSALQALALWELGLRRWYERRGSSDEVPKARAGVVLNRRDLVTVPVPAANLLWRDLTYDASARREGKVTTKKVRIDVLVEGVSSGRAWSCGLEFDFENPESLYCRPLRLSDDEKPERMAPPEEARGVKVAYLPPMSGLAANEDRLEPGSIAVRIGQGRTAEVLRNLCARVHDDPRAWERLATRMRELFGVELDAPEYVVERGEIWMTYVDERGVRLDLSASGRGLQQTLLLLAYLETSPGSVLLLDEPDAHLEILRQQEIYDVLTATARARGSQIIAASHSEVILNKAADRDVVVSFVGKPHRIDDRAKSQVAKALKEIGFDQYFQATLRGWVLYLEGSTDLAILRALAATLGHPTERILGEAFVRSIGSNQRKLAAAHFYGLREAKPDLVGAVLLDRDATAEEGMRGPLRELRWRRREIENYLALPEALVRYAASEARARPDEDLLARVEIAELEGHMRAAIADQTAPAALHDLTHPFWRDAKVSEDYLPAVFEAYYRSRGLPNLMRKSDYHVLSAHVPLEEIDPEVLEKLDAILEVSRAARPETGS